MKALNFDELLRLKQQGEEQKTRQAVIDIPGMDFALKFQKLPLYRFMTIIDDMDKKTSAEQLDVSVLLIYESCPDFQRKEMIEGMAEPTDVVLAVFDNRVKVIMETGREIIKEFYGNEDIEKDKTKLKN